MRIRAPSRGSCRKEATKFEVELGGNKLKPNRFGVPARPLWCINPALFLVQPPDLYVQPPDLYLYSGKLGLEEDPKDNFQCVGIRNVVGMNYLAVIHKIALLTTDVFIGTDLDIGADPNMEEELNTEEDPDRLCSGLVDKEEISAYFRSYYYQGDKSSRYLYAHPSSQPSHSQRRTNTGTNTPTMLTMTPAPPTMSALARPPYPGPKMARLAGESEPYAAQECNLPQIITVYLRARLRATGWLGTSF